jgi:hypothetical protein
MSSRVAWPIAFVALTLTSSRGATQCSLTSPFRFVALEILYYTGPEGVVVSHADGSGAMPFDSIVSVAGAKVGWVHLDPSTPLSQIDLVPRQPDWAFDRQDTQRVSGRAGACVVSRVFESAAAWSVQIRTLPPVLVAPLDNKNRPASPVLAPVIRGPLRETEDASWRVYPTDTTLKLHIDVRVSKDDLDHVKDSHFDHKRLLEILLRRPNKSSIGLSVPRGALPDTLWFQRVRK